MHTLKSCSVVLVLVALVSLPNLQAADNANQAALRELLRQSVAAPATNQMEAAPVAAPAKSKVKTKAVPQPVPVVVVEPKHMDAPEAAPVVAAPPATASEFTPVPESSASPEALRELLHKEATPPAVVTETTPGIDLKAQAPSAASAPAPAVEFKPAAAEPVREPASGVEVKMNPPSGNYKPVEAPPSTLAPSKEQRLAELLQKYKSDSISPEEYHHQRAAILAEP